jgi:hypothetical protein
VGRRAKRWTPKPKKSVFPHARRRALERYGLDLKEQDFKLLHAKIRRSEHLGCQKMTGSRTLFFVEYGGIILPCIYDRGVSHISTFLPKNAREWGWKKFKHLQTRLDDEPIEKTG